MTPRMDAKLERLGELLGDRRSTSELLRLGRLGDFTVVDDGTVLQREGSTTRWCYWVVGGSAVLTRDGLPLAVCGPGSVLHGGAGVPGRRTPASAEALGALEVVAFGVPEFLAAADGEPHLARALHRR